MRKIIAATLAVFAISGCGKQSLETTWNSQETKIDSFISKQLQSNPDWRVEYLGGTNRLVIAEGEGDGATASSRLSIRYAGYVFNGSISRTGLFSTNDAATAESSGWKVEGLSTDPLTVNLGGKDLVDGLRRGLVGARAGEECYVVFSGKYGFGKKKLGTVPGRSALLYHVWVEEIIK